MTYPTTQVLKPEWRRAMSACLVIWLALEATVLSFPSLTGYLSFFDRVTFIGVTTRSACIAGDPAANARLLMCAWMISFGLTVYTFGSLLRRRDFYSEFVSRSRTFIERTFVGRYSPVRFRIYYAAILFAVIGFPYYVYMLGGYLGDTSCSYLLADRWLFVQGAVVIIAGYFLGLFVVLAYSALTRAGSSDNRASNTNR